MLNRRIRTLAVTGSTIAAAVLVALSTTAASAATTTASASDHVTAPQLGGGTGCVTETFTKADEPYYLQCVADAQILLNDLWYTTQSGADHLGTNQLLKVDGSYGPDTASDVGSFQQWWGLTIDQKLGPQTWFQLCYDDLLWGYRGVYWNDAGCATMAL